jgi:hypothetical protein
MASIEKKKLEIILKPVLKEFGFRKKGGTWWRQLDCFIQVVNIQGSQFSKRFYLNLGVYIKELGDVEWPAEYDCHIRVRLNSIADNAIVNSLLDFENTNVDDEERRSIATILRKSGISWLNKCSSFEGAKSDYVLPNRFMSKFMRNELDEYFT